MTQDTHHADSVALCETLAILADFHKQPSLHLLETQVKTARPVLKPLLCMMNIMRTTHFGVVVMLWLGILIYRKPWFTTTKTDTYVVSLTPNNRRVLDQLGAALQADGIPFAINHQALALKDRLGLLHDCRAVAHTVIRKGDSNAFIFFHQILGTLNLMMFDRNLSQVEPRLVIAANDHSPPTVALFVLARTRAITSCYVQHGPITASFPPLQTDLAFLFSAKAQEDYQTAAKSRGVTSKTLVALLPALNDPFVPMRPPTTPFRLCIAVSFFTDLTHLANLIAQLQQSDNVVKIMISQHPRSTQDLDRFTEMHRVSVLPRGTPAKDIAPNTDLCLVDNSGVALEFLHYGCPTFYVCPSDAVLDDYYGFVDAGIMPRFTPSLLEDPNMITDFFDGTWHNNMARFDPLIETDASTFQKSAVASMRTYL